MKVRLRDIQGVKPEMSQIDQEKILSEADGFYATAAPTEAEQAEGEDRKLVPVAESIRYRRRAQSAERKVEVLADQLSQLKSQTAKMAEQLGDIQLERELMRKLAAAGAVDLEAAVLIAKTRLAGQEEADLNGCVERLRKEKRYLFGEKFLTSSTATQKTAGAKGHQRTAQTVLEKVAKRAATTGNRTDLQDYLKLRRNFL